MSFKKSCFKAEFSYQIKGNTICIVDQCNGECKSVTNDVENVIAKIAFDGVDLCNHRVIYRDTDGIWDEIVCKNGEFKGFRSINERNLDTALAKVCVCVA